MSTILQKSRALAASFLIPLLASPHVGAQEPPPPTAPSALPWAADPGVEDLSGPAQKLFDDAKLARKEKRFEDCYRNALGAWKLAPRAGVAALLGDCALDVDKPRDAAEYIAFFLANVPPNATPELLSYQKERFALAKAKVAVVTVKPSVASAKVTCDKKPVDGTAIYLDPGSHTCEARADGYEVASATVEVAAGTERELVLELVPSTAPPNGDDDDGPSLGVPIGGTVLALGGFCAVTSVALGIIASSKKSRVNEIGDQIRAEGRSCPDGSSDALCVESFDAAKQYDELTPAAIGTGIAGGVLLIVGGAILINEALTTEEDSNDVSIVPFGSPSSGGAMLRGSF
jgi:hypothetical protein